MNDQFNWLTKDNKAALEAAEKMFNLNKDAVEKYWQQQVNVANTMLESGLRQLQRLSEAKNFEDFLKVQNEYFEESTKQGLENARQVMEMFNNSGEVFKGLFEQGAEAVAEAAPKPATRKKRVSKKRR